MVIGYKLCQPFVFVTVSLPILSPLSLFSHLSHSQIEQSIIKKVRKGSKHNSFFSYMGGVDHCNQMMQYSTRYFRNQRWYMAVACYVLNIAAVNAYVIKRESLTTYKQKRE